MILLRKNIIKILCISKLFNNCMVKTNEINLK